MDFNAIAKKIISENLYMTIATSENNIPWITPVVFAVDDAYRFYWTSSRKTKHSEIIEKNSNIICVIFNSHSAWGTGEAVYIEGTAEEVKNDEIQHAINELFVKRWKQFRADKPTPTFTPAEFLNESDWRMYKATANKIWLLSNETKVHKDGQIIDKKVEVKLS